MKLSNFAKTFIMSMAVLFAQTISQSGLPTTSAGWAVLALSFLGSMLTYTGQNALFPSTSVLGTIDVKDLLKGLFIALGSGISDYGAHLIVGQPFSWHQLTTFVCNLVVMYISKNLITGPKPTLAK